MIDVYRLYVSILLLFFLFHQQDYVQSDAATGSIIRTSTGSLPVRTAVIISGQIRSANLSFASGEIIQTKQTRWFGPKDPPTPAASIIQNLFIPLINQTGGGIDVFMFVTYDSQHKKYRWNGDIGSYEPSPLDNHAACKIFSNHPLFASSSFSSSSSTSASVTKKIDVNNRRNNNSGKHHYFRGRRRMMSSTHNNYTVTNNHDKRNRFFCLYEEEKVLMTPWIASYSFWKTSQHQAYAEQVLQQLYGMYRGNEAAIEYALANNVHYTYKIRLRPDSAMIKPINMHAIDFKYNPNNETQQQQQQQNQQQRKDYCESYIYFASLGIFRMGNPDWFNIGLSSAMDKLLNRYLDFIHDEFPKSMLPPNQQEWILEQHLMTLLKEKYNICLHDHGAIPMIIVRKWGHKKVTSLVRNVEKLNWHEMT